MSLPAIRVVSSTAKSALGAIYLQCRIKPGASKQREGIISISDEVIEVCVSARAQEGEANRSVRDLFSSVCSYVLLLFYYVLFWFQCSF